MYIKNLKLKKFRNYDEAYIDLSPGKNIIFGLNGQGKTNIIEALYFLQSGRSYRCNKEKETIKFGCDYTRIEAEFYKNEIKNNVLFFISDKKSVKLNGVPVGRLSEIIGNINIVIFTPDHLNLIKEGPSVRRNFLDSFISQLKPSYFKNLIDYYKVLKQRNNILKSKNKDMLSTISVWNEKLAQLASQICEMREAAIERINEKINEVTKGFEDEKLKINYVPGVKGNIKDKENIIKQLEDNLERDLEYKMTMTGPHRDDFEIYMDGENIKKYGSQGQQRSCVLKLKLSECEIIKEKTGEMPPILLDDILSELDEKRRHLFIENIKNTQVIITCTDKEFLKGMEGYYFKVEKGRIKREN